MKKSKKEKFFHAVSFISIFSAILLMIVFFYWALYPYKPLVFNGGPFPVDKEKYRRGEVMSYIVEYCKSFKGATTLTRSFVNSIRYNQPSVQTDRPVGCSTMNVGVQIPYELPPGTYHLENTYVYKVNPIRTISVFHSTQDFKVTE